MDAIAQRGNINALPLQEVMHTSRGHFSAEKNSDQSSNTSTYDILNIGNNSDTETNLGVMTPEQEAALVSVIMSGGLAQSVQIPAQRVIEPNDAFVVTEVPTATNLNEMSIAYVPPIEDIEAKTTGGARIHSTGDSTTVTLASGAELNFKSSGSWRVSDTADGGVSITADNETFYYDAGGQLISTENGINPLVGTEGSDVIYNRDPTSNGKTIDAMGGNDTIINHIAGATIYGGSGNDNIIGVVDSTVYGGDGNDTINLGGDGAHYYTGESNAIVDAGAGNDRVTINVVRSNTNIDIKGGGGDDDFTIQTGSDIFAPSGSKSNNSLNVFALDGHVVGNNLTIDAGDGKDNVSLLGARQDWRNINITTGADNDMVTTSAHIYTSETFNLNTGDGNDTINTRDVTSGKSINIIGGAGDDKILMEDLFAGEEITIDGGDGNDTIDIRSLASGYVTFKGGNGDDALWTSSIVATKQGIVDGGDGDDHLTIEEMLNTTIRGGQGKDNINVHLAQNSTIENSDGEDNINVDYAINSQILDTNAHVGYAYEGEAYQVQHRADGTVTLGTRMKETQDALGRPISYVDPASMVTLNKDDVEGTNEAIRNARTL